MSVVRLITTSVVMAGLAVALTALAPAPAGMVSTLSGAQRAVDVHGADAVVVAAAGLLAWLVWAWGALGLLLTAVSGVPGWVGGLARLALRGLLPAAVRRTAALALGVGLGVAAPVVGVPALGVPAAAAAPSAAVPDWPVSPTSVGSAVPDWPVPTGHVVVRGECLWTVAAGWLRDRHGDEPSNAAIASAVRAWWTANAEVIGPDPDLLLPGQVLVPPS